MSSFVKSLKNTISKTKNLVPKKLVPKVNIKIKKKDSLACMLCMLLVVVVSQSRMLDFLMNDQFGRLLMLVFIGSVTYLKKSFGVACGLVLALAFAVHRGKLEGFDGKKCEECHESDTDCKCVGKVKKEGMCSKKKEGFSLSSLLGGNKHDIERNLQKGKVHYETIELSSSADTKPHESIKSDFGTAF